MADSTRSKHQQQHQNDALQVQVDQTRQELSDVKVDVQEIKNNLNELRDLLLNWLAKQHNVPNRNTMIKKLMQQKSTSFSRGKATPIVREEDEEPYKATLPLHQIDENTEKSIVIKAFPNIDVEIQNFPIQEEEMVSDAAKLKEVEDGYTEGKVEIVEVEKSLGERQSEKEKQKNHGERGSDSGFGGYWDNTTSQVGENHAVNALSRADLGVPMVDKHDTAFELRKIDDEGSVVAFAKNLKGKKCFAHYVFDMLPLKVVFEPFDRGRERILMGIKFVHHGKLSTFQCVSCVELDLPPKESYHCFARCLLDLWKIHMVHHHDAAEAVCRNLTGNKQSVEM